MHISIILFIATIIASIVLGYLVASLMVAGKQADLIQENYFLIQKVRNLEKEIKEREKNEYES